MKAKDKTVFMKLDTKKSKSEDNSQQKKSCDAARQPPLGPDQQLAAENLTISPHSSIQKKEKQEQNQVSER